MKGAAKYSAKQNDHHEEDGSGEGSGVFPTQKPENSISNLVNVVSDSVSFDVICQGNSPVMIDQIAGAGLMHTLGTMEAGF